MDTDYVIGITEKKENIESNPGPFSQFGDYVIASLIQKEREDINSQPGLASPRVILAWN